MANTMMKGYSLNPGGILDASDFKGKDGDVITGSQYYNGTAIKAYGPGKQIFNTGWMPPGSLVENVNIMPVWGATNASLTASVQPDIAFMQIIKRDKDTKEIITTNTFPLHYKNDTNPQCHVLRDSSNGTVSNLYLWFNTVYEYKIEIYTSGELSDGIYVTLDMVRFEHMNKDHVVMAGDEHWRTTTDATGSVTYPNIGVLFSGVVIVHTDGSGNGSTAIDRARIGYTQAASYSSSGGVMPPKLTDVRGVTATYYGLSGDNDSRITVTWGASTRYTNPTSSYIQIYVWGGRGSADEYISYTVYGYQEALPA